MKNMNDHNNASEPKSELGSDGLLRTELSKRHTKKEPSCFQNTNLSQTVLGEQVASSYRRQYTNLGLYTDGNNRERKIKSGKVAKILTSQKN